VAPGDSVGYNPPPMSAEQGHEGQAAAPRAPADIRNPRVVWLNVLTGTRLLFAAGVAVLTLWSRERTWAILASTALIGGIELTDLLDGYLARKHGLVSTFGKMFDPYSDSISRLTVYWSLAVIGRCLAVVPLIMAIRDVTVTYSRILLTRQGRDVSARHTGKLKALVQGFCAFPLMLSPLMPWSPWLRPVNAVLSAAVLLVTLASMIDYGVAAIPPRETGPQA
jgi:CDP-diacylglycerol--glycerol-3-phosphate 3-phosphatidyltransferase